MTFLPIVEREMRVAARRPQTQWFRLLAAVAAIGLAFVIFAAHQGPASTGQLSKLIFMALSVLAFGFSLLAGVFLTADCICSERREGTLELLFLTDLKGYDVALGKLAATSLVALFALLAIVPVLGLPLLIGGVTGGEVGRVSLALLVTLVFSLATGLHCSSRSRDTRSAMGATFAVLLLLTGVLFVLVWLIEEVARVRGAADLLALSPLGTFLGALDTHYTRHDGPARYWVSVSFFTVAAIAQLAAASRRLPRLTETEPSAKAEAPISLRPGPLTFRGLPVLGNPYLWLLRRERYPSRPVRQLLWVVGALWAGCLIASGLASSRGNKMHILFVIAMFSAYALHVMVKGLVAAQACRRFTEDRQSGALELLLATSLSPFAILHAQRQALWEQFRGWLKMLTVVNGLLWLAVSTGREHYDMNDGETLMIFSSFFVGGAILLFLDFRALSWVGMSEALRGQRQHRAVLSTLARALLPGWLAIFVFVFIGIAGVVREKGILTFYLVWFLANALIATVLAIGRRHEVLTRFRQLAAGDMPSRSASNPWPPLAAQPVGEPAANSSSA